MKHKKNRRKDSGLRSFGRIAGKCGIVLAEILLLAVIVVFCIGQFIAKGPSREASNMLCGFFADTGVFKEGEIFRWVAHLFYTEEELLAQTQFAESEEQTQANAPIVHYVPSTIPMPTQPGETPGPTPPVTTPPSGPQPDEWGLIDEDGDGIIVEKVKGSGFNGYMMVILDPTRVIMGAHPDQFGMRGYTVDAMVKSFGAVAGVNAGGFEDQGGGGNGSTPNTLVVFEGKVYYGEKGCGNGFAGFDSQGNLIVGNYSAAALKKMDVQYGACFGPVLIQDGKVNTKAFGSSATNPRTAIGQRSDGAVLLLVIEGRSATSIGATYQDLADVFRAYGALNACNMDGGSSSLMWYEDKYLNNSASLVGTRPVPSTFLVLAEGGGND